MQPASILLEVLLPSDDRDLALLDAADDHVRLTAALRHALDDVSTFKTLFLLTLIAWNADRQRLERSKATIRNFLGFDADEPDRTDWEP
jgi:hypothetical protein